jgi:hypothetical protein
MGSLGAQGDHAKQVMNQCVPQGSPFKVLVVSSKLV